MLNFTSKLEMSDKIILIFAIVAVSMFALAIYFALFGNPLLSIVFWFFGVVFFGILYSIYRDIKEGVII